MKIHNYDWWFIYNDDYTKCYQFYKNKLMWVIGK